MGNRIEEANRYLYMANSHPVEEEGLEKQYNLVCNLFDGDSLLPEIENYHLIMKQFRISRTLVSKVQNILFNKISNLER